MECELCKFWDATERGLGRCRRRAPKPVFREDDGEGGELDYFPYWPLTSASEFCGEFKERSENAAEQRASNGATGASYENEER